MNPNETAKDVTEKDTETSIQDVSTSNTQTRADTKTLASKTKGKRELWDINPFTNPEGRPHYIKLPLQTAPSQHEAVEESLKQLWSRNKAILKEIKKPQEPKKEKVHIHITRSNIPEFNV